MVKLVVLFFFTLLLQYEQEGGEKFIPASRFPPLFKCSAADVVWLAGTKPWSYVMTTCPESLPHTDASIPRGPFDKWHTLIFTRRVRVQASIMHRGAN